MDPFPAFLELSRAGFVATITLNRPARHNAWHPAMAADLEAMVGALAGDDGVRVIVITGAGPSFCAGLDMDYLREVREGLALPVRERAPCEGDFAQKYSYLMGVPKPVVCAINGAALGIGLVLALFCDFRWASAGARLSTMFSRRGLIPEHGMTWLLPRIVGLPQAMELMMTGRMVDANEARQLGLVNDVIADDGFREEVARRARDLAENTSPRSNRITKRLTYAASMSSLSAAVQAFEAELPGTLASEDLAEGVRHYLERRAPRFTGR